MSYVADNDYNPVDESIKFLIETFPFVSKKLVSLCVKYGKLIDQKYITLANSDEKRRIKGVTDIRALLTLSFDKLLFALDRDMYIDFMNELNNIRWTDLSSVDNDNGNRTYSNKDDNNFDQTQIKISDIVFKYLVNPSDSLNCLINGTDNYSKFYVPLIKVVPYAELSSSKETEGNGGEWMYVNTNIDENVNTFGIGRSISRINGCSVYIDITSLFNYIMNELCFFTYDKSYVMSNENKALTRLSLLNSMGSDKLDEIVDNISKRLSDKLIFSISTTYLATITKLQENRTDFMGSICNDILNSCRKTVLEGYDFTGEDMKTGMGLRHMSIDISALLNAIANDNNNCFSDEYYILKSVISYLIALKYETYNYEKVPFDNLKQKKLTSIYDVAKPSVYLLSGSTRTYLRSCYYGYNVYKYAIGRGYFNSINDLKVNGTYSLNKRIYNCAKDFIDVFAKFIIIKKRMYDSGGLNFSDGNIDKIGKRYIDYKGYLTQTYQELKVSLSNIFNRMKSVTIGKRYLTPNMMVADNNDIVRNVNKVIYGLNSESIVNTVSYNNIYDDYKDTNCSADRFRDEKSNNEAYSWTHSCNNKIEDIVNIFNVLKTRECSYAETNRSLNKAINDHYNSSLIGLWIAITESIGSYFDSPFENVKNQIGKISLGYTIKSINEMSPTNELVDYNSIKNDFKNWEYPLEKGYKSVEDLRQSFEDFKEKVKEAEDGGESVVGGMLFNDFGGIPLAQDMSYKETEIYNEKIAGVNNEETTAFESLIREYDEFINQHS